MIPLYIAATSLMIGLLSPVWFGKLLPSVRRLRNGAKWLDGLPVQTPAATPLTVQSLREHDRCGDKVVVAHHLAEWTKDLERKIFQNLVINSVIGFVLVVIFTVKNDPSLQTPTATPGDLLAAIETNWPFSILLAGGLIEIAVFVKLVSDQAGKYAKVINAARPIGRPLSERIMTLLKFGHR